MTNKKHYFVLSIVMVAIVLTATIAVVALYYLDITSEKLNQTALKYESRTELLRALRDNTTTRTILLQDMFVSDDISDLYPGYQSLSEEFNDTYHSFKSLEHNPEEKQLVNKLDTILQKTIPAQVRLIQQLIDKDREAARTEMNKPAYTRLRNQTANQFEEILSVYREKTHHALKDVNAEVLNKIHFILLLTAFILMLGVTIGFFMMRKVVGTEKLLRDEVARHIETQSALEIYRQHLEEEVQKEVDKYRKVEEARNKSQELAYATGQILEDSLNEIYIFDASTLNFIQLNKAARDNTGYSMNELKQLTLPDLLHGLSETAFKNNIQLLLSGENDLIHFTGELHRKDASSYPIEIHLQLSMMEYSPVIVAMVLDITDRKRIEEGLLHKTVELEQAQNELEYQKKAMDEHAIVSTLSKDECLQGVNQKFIDISGFTKNELIGGNVCIGTACDQPEDFFKEMSSRIQNGEVWHGIISNHRADGTPYWTKTTITPFIDTNGKIDKFISISTDITAQKLAERELLTKTLEVEQAHSQLEATHNQALQSEKLASVGQLAAGIAHEINTPIQFVGDNTRFLKEAFEDITELIALYQEQCSSVLAGELKLEMAEKAMSKSEEIDLEYIVEEVPHAISQSLEGIERVTRIVRSMKDFSHPGSDDKEMVDINHAIETTTTVCKNEWKYDAELITEFDPALNSVPCYPGELNQVILNIVVNASHAIHDARGEDDALGQIRITTKLDGDNAEIRIADNGAGMPEEVRKRIFEPFYTTKGVGKGSGQGLAIAYSVVVDKHHGSIDVDSKPGEGTTFIIRLPMDDTQETEINNNAGKIIKTGTV